MVLNFSQIKMIRNSICQRVIYYAILGVILFIDYQGIIVILVNNIKKLGVTIKSS